MGCPVGVLLGACGELGLGQCTSDETVLGVHNGCLGIYAHLFHNTCRGTVASFHQPALVVGAMFADDVLRDVVGSVVVVLEQLQGQVAGRIVGGDMLIGLEVLLYLGDAVFDLVTIVDVKVARDGVLTLVDLDYGAQ